MDRRTACTRVATLASIALPAAWAQSTRIARVAWTSIDRVTPSSPFFRRFRTAMQELGWVEGRNLVLERFSGEGSMDGLRQAVPTILASKPDVIVTAGGPATRALIDAGVSTPFAFTSSADPVLAKIVNDWARPGVNRSGISFFAIDLIPKRIELMKVAFSGLRKLAVVGWPPHAGELLELEAARNAASQLGLEHRYWGVATAPEVDAALEAARAWGANAVLVFAGAVSTSFAERFAEFSIRHRMPITSSWADFSERGNIMTYGPIIEECYGRLAAFVDRMLKGSRPADLPVERPTKFELVLNLKTAKAMGLNFPGPIQLQADRVIE